MIRPTVRLGSRGLPFSKCSRESAPVLLGFEPSSVPIYRDVKGVFKFDNLQTKIIIIQGW